MNSWKHTLFRVYSNGYTAVLGSLIHTPNEIHILHTKMFDVLYKQSPFYFKQTILKNRATCYFINMKKRNKFAIHNTSLSVFHQWPPGTKYSGFLVSYLLWTDEYIWSQLHKSVSGSVWTAEASWSHTKISYILFND